MVRVRYLLIIFLIVLVALAACSPQAQPPASTPTPEVTATVYRFPTYVYVPPTDAPQLATAGAATAAATVEVASGGVDPEIIEKGRGRYVALECGSCHGENAEGTDLASTLVGLTLTESEFIRFLRTGGTVGTSHQYASNRLSPSGGTNLYQYILSLKAE